MPRRPRSDGAAMSDDIVAVDVGGTFTDVCVLDERDRRRCASPRCPRPADPIEGVHGRRRAGGRRPRRRGAVLARHDGRHQRADHPPLSAGGDGDDEGLPRRDRDPPRHQGRALGRLQGRRAAVHPPPRPLRGDRAGRLRRRGRSSRSTRTSAREVAAHPRAAARSQTVAVCFINAYANGARAADARDPRGGAARRRGLDLAARCCRRSSSTSASRPRWPTRCCRRSSAATSRELATSGCGAAATTGDLLILHSGGGVMTPETVRALRRAPGRLRHRRGRHRQPPHRRRCAASRTRSGSTWAARSTDISLVYDGEAAHDQRVVRRVRLSDLLPVASRC